MVDLAEPGTRVGICNTEQSTLGYMTDGMLRSSGINKAVRKNVEVEVPTADFLVNQMRAGALDAAIVYLVNYQLQEEHLDFVRISHEGARAQQPFSVRGDSGRKLIGDRLLDFFKANRERFEETGFTWVGDTKPMSSLEIEIPHWLKPTDG
jgi:ABC-type molybdate transport system substrate-binding protein